MEYWANLNLREALGLLTGLVAGGFSTFSFFKAVQLLISMRRWKPANEIERNRTISRSAGSGRESRSQTEAGDPSPFETNALSRYYEDALRRANVSFWFSIAFASIGFLVIIYGVVSHSGSDWASLVTSTVKIVSGAVIDAVAGMFFVISQKSLQSLEGFFEKLRLDRRDAEARSLVEQISNELTRDQIKTQLILKYSQIDRLVAHDLQMPQ